MSEGHVQWICCNPMHCFRALFVTADGTPEQLSGFYKFKDEDGAHMVLSTALLEDDVDTDCRAHCLSNKIKMLMKQVPKDDWDNFRVS